MIAKLDAVAIWQRAVLLGGGGITAIVMAAPALNSTNHFGLAKAREIIGPATTQRGTRFAFPVAPHDSPVAGHKRIRAGDIILRTAAAGMMNNGNTIHPFEAAMNGSDIVIERDQIASDNQVLFTAPFQKSGHDLGAVAPVFRIEKRKSKPTLKLRPIADSRQPGPYVVLPAGNRSLGYLATKRLLDIVGAITLLVVFSPIMLTTYAILWITTRGKPIFCQERVGLCGRAFPMFKFRTMHVNADRMQHLVANEKDGPIFKNKRDPRITRIGRWLRSTSIDEMPQLFNILLGHMSLVGPRPPVPKEVAVYQPWQRHRLTVKPGLTCLWQVSGRCEIGFEDWVRMDIWYRENQGLLTDAKLMIKTPLSVLSQRGAY